MKEQLFAAAIEVEITPPIGTKLEGYIARQEVSCGIHDPLLASLLFLTFNEQNIVLISLDLLAVNGEIVQRIREAVAEAASVSPVNVMVSCTHTHAGPVGFLNGVPLLANKIDTVLLEMLIRKLSGAARWAKQSLQPVRLRLGTEVLQGLGKNRNDPEKGPQDTQLITLAVEDLEGEVLALWVNYGCHPTVLGYENLWISADFPGAARAALHQLYPAAVWMFTNGASGDISTRFTRQGQGFPEVHRFGYLLAGAVLKAIQTAQPLPVSVLNSWVEPIILPIRKFPSMVKAQEALEQLTQNLEALHQAKAPAGEIRIAQTRVEGAQAQLLMAEVFGNKPSLSSEIQMIQIGDFALVSMPGEPFTQTVLDIKQQSGIEFLAVVSYANDYRGYFPDQLSVERGTYEALVSPFTPGVAESLRDKALRIIREKGI